MPQGNSMGRRLEMLLNISVAGLQDVDKLSSHLKKNATSLKQVTSGLLDVEGGAENAAKNYEKFASSASKVEALNKRLEGVQQGIAEQQQHLSSLAETRRHAEEAAAASSMKANRDLEESFRRLTSIYSEAENAARKTFKPLEDEATNAQVSMRQLKESLASIKDSYRKLSQVAEQPRDLSGRFSKEPVQAEKPDLSKINAEKDALMERAKIIEETIKKVDQLTKAQQNYAEAQKGTVDVDGKLKENATLTHEVEKAIERLTQKKQALIEKTKESSTTLKQYKDVQKRLKAEQSELAEMTEHRAQTMAKAEQKSVQATNQLKAAFESLKAVYTEAGEAAGTTFKPLEGGAKNAQVNLKQLKDALAKVGKAYYELDEASKQPGDTGKIEQEKAALMERSNLLRETIQRAQQLTDAQKEYGRAKKEVTELDKKQSDSNRLIQESEEAVERLTQKKDTLLQKIHQEGQAQQALKKIHKELQTQQAELTKLAREKAKITAGAGKAETQAANQLKTVFKELETMYAKAGQAAGQTFKPLGDEANNAQVEVEQLRTALEHIKKSYQDMAKAAERASARPDQPGEQLDQPGAVNLEKIEQEKTALMERAKIIEETIKRAEQLTQAQENYAKIQGEVAQVEERMAQINEQTGRAQENNQKLLEVKQRLVAELEKEGRVLNEMAGRPLVEYNKEKGEAIVRTRQLESAVKMTGAATESLSRQIEQTANSTRSASRAKRQAAVSSNDLRDQLQLQSEEWNVMRQRISKNNEALWGLRRQLGALRNQILVVLFATRWLRNAMASARDTIIEVDQGMTGLRRTAISMGQDFQHLEKITREFEKRGLQNADEAAVALRNILQTGLGVQEATNLLYVFTDAASFNARSQRDLTDAVIRASEAFRDQRAQGLQAIGISQRMTDMVRAHANATGQQSAEVMGLERHQAIYNAIMQESIKFTGNANDLLNTFEGRLISLSGASKSASEAFGNLLRPVFMEFVGAMIEANQGATQFFKTLKEAHESDIEKWATRLSGLMTSMGKVFGGVAGSLLTMVLRYGDLVVMLSQVLVAKAVYNKMLVRKSKKLLEATDAVKGYTFATKASTASLGAFESRLIITNKLTGEQVTGLKAVSLMYYKERLELMKNVNLLKLRANVQHNAIVSEGHWAAAMRAKGGVMNILKQDHVLLNTTLAQQKAAIVPLTGWWIKFRVAVQKSIAPVKAASAAIRAAGGVMRVTLVALKALGWALIKFFAIFLAIQGLVKFISYLTGASKRAQELADANDRLNRSFDQLATTMDRTMRRFRHIQERSDMFGVDIDHLNAMKERIDVYYESLLFLQEKHNKASNAKEQERWAKKIESLRETLDTELDMLETHSQKKLEVFQRYDELALELQDKNQEALTQVLSKYGVDQLYEARKNQTEFLNFLHDNRRDIEQVMGSSAAAEIRITRWKNEVILENERKAMEAQKELREDLQKAVIDTQRAMMMERLSLEEESYSNIRKTFKLRREILQDENDETIKAYEERIKGLELVVEVERKAIQDRINALTEGVARTVNAINAETRRMGSETEQAMRRRYFLKPFDDIKNELDSLNTELARAEGPTQFINALTRLNEVTQDFNKLVDDPADNLRKAFTPALEELDPAMQNHIKSLEGAEKQSALYGKTIQPLIDIIDSLRIQTSNNIKLSIERVATLDAETRAYRDSIKELEDKLRIGFSNLNLEERQTVSAYFLAKAYERADKAVDKLNRTETRRSQVQGIKDTNMLNELQTQFNKLMMQSHTIYTEVHAARDHNTKSIREFNLSRAETITGLNAERDAIKRNLDILKEERAQKAGLWVDEDLRDLNERIGLLDEQYSHAKAIIDITEEQLNIEHELLKQENAMALSRAHLAFITNQLAEEQQRHNEMIQHEQELMSISIRHNQVKLIEEELTARSRLLPVLGHILTARREGHRTMQAQTQEQRNEIENLKLQRDGISTQQQMLEDYLRKNKDLKDQEKLQADMRLVQLREQLMQTEALIGANERYADALERQLDIQRRQDLTRALTDHMRPTIDMYQSFQQSLSQIDDQILLDRHKFQLEYMDQLKHGEINHAQHTHIMLAQQQYLAAREQHLRQQRLASLVRDVGREISLYAARLAAQSGNIVAAVALLAGGAGIIAASHNIASRIERQSTMAFQQAEVEFQRAQRQMQQMEQGTTGDDSRSRKFGGTIRADNLVVNISPTMIVEGEQIFIGGGSAVEFSREVSEMMMEAIQNSIDNRRIDLSNIARGN